MRTSTSMPRRSALAIAIVAALALAGISAAPASAATWSQGETSMMWSSPALTLEKSGGSEVSCAVEEVEGYNPFYGAVNGGSYLGGVTNYGYYTSTTLECDGGSTLTLCTCLFEAKKQSAGVYTVSMYNRWGGLPSYEGPYGTYSQQVAKGTFVNGNVSQPSTLTFTDASLGGTYPGNEPITISGTIQVTDAKGGLLTLTGS